MYLVQTFEIVWLGGHFKKLQPDCNMRRLMDNWHFFSVSSLVNSSKVVIGWHARDVTANRHVGQNEIDIHTPTGSEKWQHSLKPYAFTCASNGACPTNIKDIKKCIYISDENA